MEELERSRDLKEAVHVEVVELEAYTQALVVEEFLFPSEDIPWEVGDDLDELRKVAFQGALVEEGLQMGILVEVVDLEEVEVIGDMELGEVELEALLKPQVLKLSMKMLLLKERKDVMMIS